MGIPTVRWCGRQLRILVDGCGAATTGNSRSETNELVGEESTESRKGSSGCGVIEYLSGNDGSSGADGHICTKSQWKHLVNITAAGKQLEGYLIRSKSHESQSRVGT